MEEKKLKILYIEDDIEDFFIIKESLNDIDGLDFEIEQAQTCEKGMARLAKNEHDVCLLDYRLGNSTGLDFLNTVNAFLQPTPIIFLTGQGDRNLDVEAMKAGASDYISKNRIDGVTLERTIRHAIERKKYEGQLLEVQDELTMAIMEIKDNQKKLIEMENLKSVRELAGAVAHEFAQPLQALSNYVSLLRNGTDTEKYITKSEDMVGRIAELTENLRNITQLSKKEYVDTQILDINNLKKENKLDHPNRVLILDDEQIILDTLLEMFEIRGFECSGVSNGEEALELVKKHDFDMIISDVNMPGMSGPEFFEKVKAMGNTSTFIFLTGYEITDDVKSIVNMADGLLNKPVVFDHFFTKLEEINSVQIV
ncbi:MAG: response regulator [Calditrichaeota bacterium]|nr:MAG: response regulator [Calditrichota bacterium]MBL1207616.1 response regulator [Calditrichota bacterium]NOG47449.1 response regulator [Calditrichota bacterium]